MKPKGMLRPYASHGVNFTGSSNGENWQAICPYCQHEQLYIHEKTGQFRCWRENHCAKIGNVYTFLGDQWNNGAYNESQIGELYNGRACTTTGLINSGLRQTPMGLWVLPGFTKESKISNLWIVRHLYDKEKKKHYFRIDCTAGINQRLFVIDPVNWQTWEEVYICEGHWDAICLQEIFDRAGLDREKIGVVAVPGAHSFKEDWLSWFDQPNLEAAHFVYDNDAAGSKGTTKAAELLNAKFSIEINAIDWPPILQKHKVNILQHFKLRNQKDLDGFDISDLIKILRYNPAKVCDTIKTYLIPFSLEKTEMGDDQSTKETRKPKQFTSNGAELTRAQIPCESFRELVDHYCKGANLHVTRGFETVLASAIATVLSTPRGGEQIWMRIIGPPGSGKSTIAEMLSKDRLHVLARSNLTGLHSGFGRGNQKSNSLIVDMNHRCLIVKDADPLIQNPSRAAIESELRDVYDGNSRMQYRTGKIEVHEDLRSTVILCGTDILRTLDDSILGARFLTIEIYDEEMQKRVVEAAAAGMLDKINQVGIGESAKRIIPEKEIVDDSKEAAISFSQLQGATGGFVRHKIRQVETYQFRPIPKMIDKKIQAMADLISHSRAEVMRGRDRQLKLRARVASSTRVVQQLQKLLWFLPIVFDRKISDCVPIVRKVAVDTSAGFKMDIFRQLFTGPMDAEHISSKIQLSGSQTRRILDDLVELKIVRTQKGATPTGSKGSTLYHLSKKMATILKNSGAMQDE